jgi:hypothetical protein
MKSEGSKRKRRKGKTNIQRLDQAIVEVPRKDEQVKTYLTNKIL